MVCSRYSISFINYNVNDITANKTESDIFHLHVYVIYFHSG